MAKKTSINIQPMKPGCEVHNMRQKDLDYIRKELTHLNESWVDPRYEGKSMADVRKEQEKRYKETVGQKMQSKAQPLREGVVVIDDCTTMEQMQRLAVAMEEKFGIKTIQIHIHRDEGYPNAEEWTPNLHAHMMFDWTKPNGKSLSLNKSHMSELQTLVADVLEMERGESSDRKHLSAIQYKNKKEGERLIALQQQNTELQAQVEQYQESNEQLRSENEELLLKAEEIRKTVADLQSTVKKMKLTKNGKQAVLIALNKITDIFGKSDMQIEKEQLQAKVDKAEKELKVWQHKVEKLQADLERRTAERDDARKEKAALERTMLQKNKEISDLESDLIKSRKESLRLGRIAEPWNHVLPDVVKIDRCQVVRTPRGHAIQLHIEGNNPKLVNVSYENFERYRKAEISLEHLIAIYATHEIDVAVARKLRDMNTTKRKSAIAKLANTLFHALPAILYPALAANVSVSHGTNGYVGIHHKSLDDIIRDMIDEGYQIHR